MASVFLAALLSACNQGCTTGEDCDTGKWSPPLGATLTANGPRVLDDGVISCVGCSGSSILDEMADEVSDANAAGPWYEITGTVFLCARGAENASCMNGSGDLALDVYDGHYVQITASNAGRCLVDTSGEITCHSDESWEDARLLEPPTTNGVRSVSMSDALSLACVVDDGGGQCWGGSAQSWPAEDRSLAGDFTQVSAADYYACALDSSGFMSCWGPGVFATPPADVSFTAVGATEQAFCGLEEGTGAVDCWSWPDFGPVVLDGTGYTTLDVRLNEVCARAPGEDPVCVSVVGGS